MQRPPQIQTLGRSALLLAVPLIVGAAIWFVAGLTRRQAQLVEHTFYVQIAVERMGFEVRTAEANERHYLSTGDRQFLESSQTATSAARNELSALSNITADNPLQQQRAARMQSLLDEQLSSAESRFNQPDVHSAKAFTSERVSLGRSIQDLLDEMNNEEQTLLRSREGQLARTRTMFYLILVSGYGLMVLVVGSLYFSARRYSRQYRQAEAKLSQSNQELNERVREGTSLLRAREELLNTFVEKVPAAVAMLDRNMCHLKLSDRWCSDYQLERGRLEGVSHYDSFPDIPDHWKAIHSRCLAGETLHADEDQWIRSDGRMSWRRWEIRPWGSKNDLPEGILIFAEDITERKLAEQALRESEERFRALSEHASDAFFLSDLDGRFIDINQQACVSLGYTREELLGMPAFDLEEDFDRTAIKKVWEQVVSTGPVTLEGHHRRKDGSRFPVEVRLSSCYVGGKQLILALVRDVTERRRTEMQLRESEATIRTLLDTASQAILAIDSAGAIVMANRMVGQTFAYAPTDLIGQPIEKLIPDWLRVLDRDYLLQVDSSPSQDGLGCKGEASGLRSDGDEFPIELSVSTVETKEGLLLVSFITDISQRKAAEQALKDSERQVRTLMGSLLTAQEDERRSFARELHDDISQQLARLSIGLGNLNVAIPDADVISRLMVQDLQKQALHVSSGVRRLSRGMHPSVISDFGIDMALEEFCEDFEKAHSVSVGFEKSSRPIELTNAQATCMYRVTQESMRNAVTHGNATEIMVSLSVEHGGVQLRVSDNGGGFNGKRSQGKMGLGIISMTERVRILGGTLSVRSALGQGTEVAALLPIGVER